MSLMMTHLETLIAEWGHAKGILPNPNKLKQAEKTQEELDEMVEAIYANDREAVKDAIGDQIVTLIMQCQAWDLGLVECMEAAYNEIVNRTGKMVDGQFVKDE